jgi:hypothetical protein
MTDATAELTMLRERQAQARARADGLEQEWRAAAAGAQEASTALAEGERHGLSASKRHGLEERLTSAKARAAEAWPERVEGAKAAVRDADREVRAFVTTHLAELVTDLEAEGRLATEEVNAAAADLIAAQAKREQIASALGAMVTLVQAPAPGDVTYSAAEDAARAAAGLAAAGGEVAPALRRDRPPWDQLLTGAEREQVPA